MLVLHGLIVVVNVKQIMFMSMFLELEFRMILSFILVVFILRNLIIVLQQQMMEHAKNAKLDTI